MWLAHRVQTIQPSPTLAIEAKAKALKAQGVDIISFGAGEPDFDTPENIKQAAITAIQNGFTKYCPVTGTPDLKQAIIEKFQQDNNLSYSPDEIIVSCGAKHSLYNLFQAVFSKGDEVLVPAPYWVSYPDMAALAGAKATIIPTKQAAGFKVTAAQLAAAAGKRTKAVVINSPSNPTGSTYTAAELEALGRVCIEKNLLIISDEIYEKLVYDGSTAPSIASLLPEIKERTVVVNGVSKSYAMTGWRIGYAAGPKEIICAMGTIQSQSTSNPTSISLKAATEALRGSQDSVATMRAEFQKRRDYVVGRLNAIPGITCLTPQGAFYVFPRVRKLLGKSFSGTPIATSALLAEYLLDTAKIATVPGEAFGAPGYLRLSYASALQQLTTGLDRLQAAAATAR
jgi:aspartate aminotransferase